VRFDASNFFSKHKFIICDGLRVISEKLKIGSHFPKWRLYHNLNSWGLLVRCFFLLPKMTALQAVLPYCVGHIESFKDISSAP
jgi:hypothetical protein